MSYWKQLRDDIRARRKLSFQFGRAAIAGTFTAEAYHEDCPMPLAVVWFGFFGHCAIQIQNSFVFEYARRAGLRTYIHEQMLAAYPKRYVLSGSGNKIRRGVDARHWLPKDESGMGVSQTGIAPPNNREPACA